MWCKLYPKIYHVSKIGFAKDTLNVYEVNCSRVSVKLALDTNVKGQRQG